MAAVSPEEKHYFEHWTTLPAAGIRRLIESAYGRLENVQLVVPGGEWYTGMLDLRDTDIFLDYPVEMRDGARLLVNALPVEWIRKLDGFKYGFYSPIREMPANDGKPGLSVLWPERLYRMQRRGAFRVSVPIEDAGTLQMYLPESLVLPAFIEDLSVTGVRFSFVFPLTEIPTISVGMRVNLAFTLSGTPHVSDAVIVREMLCGTPSEHEKGLERMRVAARFLAPERLSKLLQSYLFAQQRRMAKK